MKILITVPVLSSGSGLTRYIFTLCKILHKNNKILVLETHGHSSNDYAKSELIKISPDIQFITLGTTGKINKYLKSISFTRQFNSDIIISNYNALTQYILPFCKKHAKVIHILHNDTDDFYRIGKINGNKVDIWIAPTNGIAERFNKYTHNKYLERVITISHGVDGVKYNAEKRKNKKLEIVFAGVIYEHKGVKIIPEILRQLRLSNIDFHLTIIGGGDLSDWLQSELEYYINNGFANMTGVIPHADVYKYFEKSDIFLYPTHIDAFGLVIAEAMINGAVPIVTDIPGVTDNLIEDGKSGFLLNRDDTKSFAECIIRLANDRTLLKLMSTEAKTRAEKLFSLDTMKRNYLHLLNEL